MPNFIPKSERLIIPLALAPHISFLLTGCGAQRQWSTVSDRGLVTPSRVALPSMTAGASPLNTTRVDLNVMVGNSATLKKSGERRCSSRERGRLPLSLSPVEIEAVCTVMSRDAVLAARSIVNLPESLSNLPRILDMPFKCPTSKCR